ERESSAKERLGVVEQLALARGVVLGLRFLQSHVAEVQVRERAGRVRRERVAPQRLRIAPAPRLDPGGSTEQSHGTDGRDRERGAQLGPALADPPGTSAEQE